MTWTVIFSEWMEDLLALKWLAVSPEESCSSYSSTSQQPASMLMEELEERAAVSGGKVLLLLPHMQIKNTHNLHSDMQKRQNHCWN